MKLVRLLTGLVCVVVGIAMETIGRAGTWLVDLGQRIDGDLE